MRELLLEERDGRTAAALIEGGRLEDLMIDPRPDDAAPVPGAIHGAKVDRLVPRMGAAFLRLSGGGMGFLREARGLREGQSLVVQVVSHPDPGKAAPVTRRILIKGRSVILSPEAPGVNVARGIRDEETRARLLAAVEPLMRDAPKGLGAILRTAAEMAPEAEIAAEAGGLLARHARIMAEAAGAEGPLDRPSAAATALAEWTATAPRRIVIPAAIDRALRRGVAAGPLAALLAGLPASLARLVAPSDQEGPFAEAGVPEALDALASARVDLPSGGWIAVEPTAALVAIDVNTADRFGGGDALTATLEAAREIPRQLRLRGLGGQILADPAPIQKKDRRRVEDALKTAFRRDPIETTLHGWTQMGLFEIQRKRERRPLAELLPF